MRRSESAMESSARDGGAKTTGPKAPSFGWLQVAVGLGVILLGMPLHYLYGATGASPFAAVFGPVNESAWEHFKLFYWPLVLLSLAAYPLARTRTESFFLPSFVAMLVSFAGMSAFYYIPRALFGSSLFLSIASFVAGAALAQVAGFLLSKRRFSLRTERVGLLLTILLGLVFAVFTFFPPRFLPWLDVKAGIWGLPP